MVAKRWGVWLLCLSLPACWGGEPRTRGPAIAAEPAPAATEATGAAVAASARGVRGVLTDADLAAVAAGGPIPAATPEAAPEAPLPQGAIIALEATVVDATEDLSISFGSSRAEVLRSALDAASVMDEPLPAPSLSDLPPVPAAPAPDL